MVREKRKLEDSAKDPSAKDLDEFVGKRQKRDTSQDVRQTFYIFKAQILALDRIRAKRLEAGAGFGEVDRSSLAREAIDLLIKREGV